MHKVHQRLVRANANTKMKKKKKKEMVHDTIKILCVENFVLQLNSFYNPGSNFFTCSG